MKIQGETLTFEPHEASQLQAVLASYTQEVPEEKREIYLQLWGRASDFAIYHGFKILWLDAPVTMSFERWKANHEKHMERPVLIQEDELTALPLSNQDGLLRDAIDWAKASFVDTLREENKRTEEIRQKAGEWALQLAAQDK